MNDTIKLAFISLAIGTLIGAALATILTLKSLENKTVIWNDDPESFHPTEITFEMIQNDTIYVGPRN